MSDWEARFAAFLERVMATAVVNGDPRALRVELDKLIAEAPPERRRELEGARDATAKPATER